MFCLTVLLCTGGQSGHSAFPQGALSLAPGDRTHAEILKRSVDPRNHNDNRSVAYSTPFGQLDWSQIRNKVTERDGNYYLQKGDLTLELTLDPHLQRDIQATLARERYIGAGVVMLDARTGAIAAIGELRSEFDTPLSSLPDQITRVRAPAASLMKIFTAAAAVQEKGMEPETEKRGSFG
jgi:membrane peptidoglycan carboxypeptidase